MFKICIACGCSISSESNICKKCEQEFKITEQQILASEDAKYIRFCKYCGRPFIAACNVTYAKNNKTVKRMSNRQFCHEHYAQCKICGKAIKFDNNKSFIPSTCSKECMGKLRAQTYKNTCQERYGVDAIMQHSQFKEKYKENSLRKYGVENPFQLNSVKEKYKDTCLQKYGVEYPMQSEEIKQKALDSCLGD